MYKNKSEVIKAYLDWLEDQTRPVTGNEPELKEFSRLLTIYHYAYQNPPEGVIGVGAITYAENKLIEAQSK